MIDEKVKKIEDVKILKKILKTKHYPPYSPLFESDLEKVSGKYNCYAHIWGFDKSEIEQFPDYEVFDIPGFSGFEFEYPENEEELVRRVFQDMKLLGVDIKVSSINEPLKKDEWKIAIYYSNYDFHFMRQDRDGTWSHKLGYSPHIFYENTPPEKYNVGMGFNIPPYKLVSICTLKLKQSATKKRTTGKECKDINHKNIEKQTKTKGKTKENFNVTMNM